MKCDLFIIRNDEEKVIDINTNQSIHVSKNNEDYFFPTGIDKKTTCVIMWLLKRLSKKEGRS